MERRLGRGLGSLLAPPPPPEASISSRNGPGAALPLGRIRPNPFQPRKSFPPGALQELQASIQAHGVLQPIVVRSSPEGFELISGERRWRAAQAAGLQTIPAVIREGVSDGAMLELALVENLQRADLDPIEKARGFHQLLDRGLTQEEVASKVGLQRPTVTNHLRLLDLGQGVQKALAEGLITMGHARAILGLPGEKRQEELCALVVRQDLSVRQVEARVRDLAGRSRPGESAAAQAAPAWVRDMESRMRNHLGTKVQLRNGEGYRGQIVIDYHGREDLDRLFGLLAPRKAIG